MSRQLTSRFFIRSDPRTEQLILPLPPYWWSRFYEYEWARQFCDPNDVALDAGCGISHPFKFYLSDVCREVHACDIDARILSPEAILNDIANDFGADAAKSFPLKYFQQLFFARASLTALPYEDNKFDKIYCISVLEHLSLTDMFLSMQEFKRTLKDDGMLLLTLDYPIVDLIVLINIIEHLDLEFAGDLSLDLPEDALFSSIYGLYCFKAAVRKKRGKDRIRAD